jgi:hypothetical protein
MYVKKLNSYKVWSFILAVAMQRNHLAARATYNQV